MNIENMKWPDGIKDVPESSGVYIFYNDKNEVIYVGKATSLKDRLRSYLDIKNAIFPKDKFLRESIKSFDYIITSSPSEALLLEYNLIKKHKPKYNIRLKDDKSYPYLKIVMDEFPYIEIKRGLKNDNALYFGPYVDVKSLRRVVSLGRRIFKLRRCTKKLPKKKCIYYDLGECSAPCIGNVSKEDYLKLVKDFILFIKSDYKKLRESLINEMNEKVKKLEFEKAAVLRDAIKSIDRVFYSQRVLTNEDITFDTIYLLKEIDKVLIEYLEIRNGRLVFEGSNFPDRFSKKPGGIFALGVNWWDPPFKGKIDELRIYDRALMQDEIKVLAGDKVKEGGLIAWFKFEDNLQDSTGNFNEGVVIGNKIDVPGGQISYGEGVVGKAVYLDGNSGVRLPNGLISSYEYTVSLWVYAEKLTMFTPTFFGAMSQTKWISVVPYGHNGVGNSIMVWSGSEKWIDGGTGVKINPNTWTHIAFTVKRGNLTVYVNGEKKYEGTGVPNIFNSYDGIFTLGVNWWDAPFKGMIDELKIYDISLSQDEIKKLSQTK